MENQDIYPDMESWLSAHYLIENPFEYCSADLEKDRKITIYEYFYQFPYFEGIVKPKCSFLFLKRGVGKTANRVMLEHLCEESVGVETKLAVPYTDFSHLISKQQVALEDHVGEILRQAVPRLFVEAVKQEKSLHPQDAKDFAWFIARYSEKIHHQSVKEQIRQIQKFSDEQKRNFLLNLLDFAKKNFEKLLDKWGVLLDLLSMVLKFTEDSKDTLPEISHSPMDLMKRLAEIAQQLNINQIYILIDGTDEFDEPDDFSKPANTLKPLVKNIRLLEMRPYAFKFFLPAEMKSDISPSIRKDRFDLYEYTWKPEELSVMFKSRLSAYCDKNKKELSEEERGSFSRLFAPEMRLKYSSCSDKIEPIISEMIEITNKKYHNNPNSPRYLLRLANFIFYEHCRFEIEHYIAEKSYKDAVERFNNE